MWHIAAVCCPETSGRNSKLTGKLFRRKSAASSGKRKKNIITGKNSCIIFWSHWNEKAFCLSYSANCLNFPRGMSVEICHVSKYLALMMIEVTKVQEIMKVISFSLEFIYLANNRGLLHFKLCTRRWSQLCPQKGAVKGFWNVNMPVSLSRAKPGGGFLRVCRFFDSIPCKSWSLISPDPVNVNGSWIGNLFLINRMWWMWWPRRGH